MKYRLIIKTKKDEIIKIGEDYENLFYRSS